MKDGWKEERARGRKRKNKGILKVFDNLWVVLSGAVRVLKT